MDTKPQRLWTDLCPIAAAQPAPEPELRGGRVYGADLLDRGQFHTSPGTGKSGGTTKSL